ncbi:ADP-ribose pyrophosphatase [Candidatus Methanophagaceae archaeon]|nr:ADP-ribose pyrophosphatase [Methanophagales archaeon]
MQERTVESKQIYEGRRVKLHVDRVVLTGGRETTREVVDHPDCVAIIAVDAENNVMLVRQFRYALARELLEIPAGVIEPGEEPIHSAFRELEEETGYTAAKMERLGGFYSSPGCFTEYLHLFLATELEPGNKTVQEDEIIEVVPVPLEQVHNLITSGELQDAKSIAGLLLALPLHLGTSKA